MTSTADPAPQLAFERELPNDIPAEQAVLGCMMLSKDAIGEVVEVVREEDFYRPAHQILFAAMVDMYGRGDHVDITTLFDHLRKQSGNLIARVGGGLYLHTLISADHIPAAVGSYARIVREQAVLRRQIEWGARVMERAYKQEGDADELLNLAMAEMTSIPGVSPQDDYAPVGSIMPDTLDMMEAISSRSGQLVGVPTGFKDLDELTTGLLNGQLIVIAARPAIGKSCLALDLLRSASIKHRLTSVLFSLEMSRSEVVMRMLSSEARVPLHHIKSGTMSDDDWTRMARRMTEIAKAPLYIDDSPNMGLAQIRAKARRLKEQQDLRLIVVDYMQLMTAPPGTNGRQEAVSEISRSLKLLAKELNVPVVALSQLNRGPEQRTDKKPQVSDLRESGSIEQDSDVVILIHREDAYDKESPRAGEADLIVGKHRNGPTATVTVAFQGHYSRFVDMATD